jgi:6-phosphogluconolactonase (cycloisomerase 2 family)
VRRHAIGLAALAAILLGLFSDTAGAAGLYAPNYGLDPETISGFNASPDGSLSSMEGSPFEVTPGPTPPVGGIVGLAFTPDGRRAVSTFLFKGGAQGLSVTEDGSIAPAGVPIVSASSTSLAVSPDGRFAYAPTREFEMVPEEGIRGYRIGADASLTALPTPFGSGQSYDIAITPDGRFLYQQAGNQVRRFAVESDGTLAELGMTPAGGVSELATSPDGRFLFVGIDDMSDGVRSFSIAADGSLTQNGEPALTGDSTMGFFAVGPDGRHIYMPDINLNGIVTATVAADGTLAVIDTMPVAIPQAVAVSPDNRFLYYGNNSLKIVGVASLGADGVPTLLPFTIPWDSGEPERLVFGPAPTPVAGFSSKPGAPGANSRFDASGSVRAARFDWNFGDGTTLPNGGPTPTHRYARAGVYEVRLTVADDGGCSTEQIYTGQSTTCPGGPEATTTASLDTPPAISGLAVTNKTFAVGIARRNNKWAAQPSRLKKVKRGTAFRYRLTERARLRFTIERKRPGRRVGGKCRPSTPANRKRKKCTRFKQVGRIRAAGKRGKNRTGFSGKLKGKNLQPGRYRATAVATDSAGGKSTPRRVSFQIVAGGHRK